MSIKAMSLVFDAEIGDGKESRASSRKIVLLALADYVADDGTGAYPSRNTLVQKTELKASSLNYALSSLVHDGWIIKIGYTKYHTIRYSLNIRKLETTPRLPRYYKNSNTSATEVPTPRLPRFTTSATEENPLVIHQSIPQQNTQREKSAVCARPAKSAGGRQTGSPSPLSNGPDERKNHPAIKAVKKAKDGLYPPKGIWDDLIKYIGEFPDEFKLKSNYSEWLRRGYNARAFDWAMAWYQDGIPDPKHKSAKTNGAAASDAMEQLRRAANGE